MIKKTIVFILTLYLIIISGSLAIAQTCPNIVGDWDYTIKSAYCDPSYNCGFEEHKGVFHITNQDGCFFYGEREILDNPENNSPLTGAIINPRAIQVTAGDRIYSGTLSGYDRTTGVYMLMKYTRSNLQVSGSDMMKTGLGKAIRR